MVSTTSSSIIVNPLLLPSCIPLVSNIGVVAFAALSLVLSVGHDQAATVFAGFVVVGHSPGIDLKLLDVRSVPRGDVVRPCHQRVETFLVGWNASGIDPKTIDRAVVLR